MNSMLRMVRHYYAASHLPEYLAPVLDLVLRLFLADVFFRSGLTKIKSWDSTLYLFRDVYQVPLLSPDFAACIATGAELGLSVMLVLGLFGRFAATGLFILNVVAVISYSELSEAGLRHHLYWGLLLAVLLMISRGKLSIDYWLEKRIQATSGA